MRLRAAFRSALFVASWALMILSLATIFQEPPRFLSVQSAAYLFIVSVIGLVAVMLWLRDTAVSSDSKTTAQKVFYFLGSLVGRVVSPFAFLLRASAELQQDNPVTSSRPGNLIERNQDLIAKRVSLISPSSDAHYVENQVRFCITEIAGREGKQHVAPEHEWLSQWEQRPNIPVEYQRLKNHLVELFEARHGEVLRLKQQQEVAERKRLEDLRREELLARNQDLIDKFLDITERKVSVLDDYGDEHWDVLPDEVRLCVKKIVQREGLIDKWNEAEHWARQWRKPDRLRPGRPYGKEAELQFLLNHLPEEYRGVDKALTELFQGYHEHLRTQLGEQTDLDSLSGPEFEMHVAKLLISEGYDVAGTSKTGDQGADLIAKKDGKKIIVQAKRYQGPVGNKAVQEVISALSFYGGDEGWVVTNSTFTASAKALAQKAGIRLVDGRSLQTEQL